MTKAILIVCVFTFLIHMTESLAYCMRLAGLRSRQIAIAMSFVTSTLLISRLSNMFQAPVLGTLVDLAVLRGTPEAIASLEHAFRLVIFAAFLGSLVGAFLTPTLVILFQKAITRFLKGTSLPGLVIYAAHPARLREIWRIFKPPSLAQLRTTSLKNLPKGFLMTNAVVTSVYTIGVLCALLAGAYLPDFRATAFQLSGIVNGLATILLTLVVDPSGARITDQAYHGVRPDDDVRNVVFFLLVGRLVGTLVLAQVIFLPFSAYIAFVTKLIAHVAL